MFNGTSYLYKVPNLPSFTAKYPFRQLDLQISNPSTQPTHFASCQLNPPSFFHVDMFPLTANFSFFGRVATCPKSASPRKSLVFKPFSYIYLLTRDIKHTVSTWLGSPTSNLFNTHCTREWWNTYFRLKMGMSNRYEC